MAYCQKCLRPNQFEYFCGPCLWRGAMGIFGDRHLSHDYGDAEEVVLYHITPVNYMKHKKTEKRINEERN